MATMAASIIGAVMARQEYDHAASGKLHVASRDPDSCQSVDQFCNGPLFLFVACYAKVNQRVRAVT